MDVEHYIYGLLYFSGMLTCNIYIMMNNEKKFVEKWEVAFMALSLTSWIGFLVFFLLIKIRDRNDRR